MQRLVYTIILCFFVRTGFSQYLEPCPCDLYYEAIGLLQCEDTILAQEKLYKLYTTTKYGDLSEIYNLYSSKSIKSTKLNQILNVVALQKGSDINFFNTLLKKNSFDTISLTSSIYVINRAIYLSKLDSFLISEIIMLEERDQNIRKNYNNSPEQFKKLKYIDSTNIVLLKSLIKYNNGNWPKYEQLGDIGSSALNTILLHFDIENINDLLPLIFSAIKQGDYFDAESILYQVDRNVVGSDKLYLYDSIKKYFNILEGNKKLHDKIGYFQYYGGIDVFDFETKRKYLWPINPTRDMKLVSSFLHDLCLPVNNPLKERVLIIDPNSFISKRLKHR